MNQQAWIFRTSNVVNIWRSASNHADNRKKRPYGFWNVEANQRQLIQLIEEKENMKPHDWLTVENISQLVRKYGGGKLLNKYNNSWDMIKTLRGDLSWPSIPPKIPRNYWNSLEHQRLFWKEAAKQLNVQQVEEWTRIKVDQIKQIPGGAGVLSKYENCLQALQAAHPGVDFEQKKKSPDHYWSTPLNQRLFLENAAASLGVRTPSDWCSVQAKDIEKLQGGRSFLRAQRWPLGVLQVVWPDIDWVSEFNKKVQESRVPRPRNYWNNVENQLKELELLRHSLCLDIGDLRKLKISQFPSVRYIASKYTSFLEALIHIYPDYNWDSVPPRVSELDNITSHNGALNDKGIVPKNHWTSPANQRVFMEQTRKQLGISNIADWITQPVESVTAAGGAGLLKRYSSFTALLQSVYPEHCWNEADRKQVSRNYWDTASHVRLLMDRVKTTLHITEPNDWCRVSSDQIASLGGAGLKKRYGSLAAILSIAYPECDWSRFRLTNRNKRAAQRWLLICLRRLFPGEEIVEDFLHKETPRASGSPLELDIFIPAKNIGFEYHGVHHFVDVPIFGPLELYRSRDEEKKAICQSMNIKLVVIPYSWDNSESELAELIRQQLLPEAEINKV